MSHKLVDPERIFEDYKRRGLQKYTGDVIYKWQDGNIINVSECYDIEIPDGWTDCIRHFEGYQKSYKICGKLSASVFKGAPKKIIIERSIPMEKFYLEEK